MTHIAPLQAEFLALLDTAARHHANDLHIRIEGERAMVRATVSGSVMDVADWPASRCGELLPAAFRLTDGEDDYVYGDSRSARMTGARVALPATVSMVFLQFFPARDGQRHLVARITRESDTCCGTCGG
jgi:hypothetical protein